MTSQIQGRSSAFTLLLTLLLIAAPSVCFSAEDMWNSVFEYQQKMAEYGNPEAQVKLGEMYEEGHGTEQNFDKARQWYQKAEKQGYAPAKKKLNQLDVHRKQAAAERLRQEQERIAREEQERIHAEQEAQAAEQAKHNQDEQKRQNVSQSSARKQAPVQAEKKQPNTLSVAEKAKKEAEARKRAAEAIKKMMAVPSAYSED